MTPERRKEIEARRDLLSINKSGNTWSAAPRSRVMGERARLAWCRLMHFQYWVDRSQVRRGEVIGRERSLYCAKCRTIQTVPITIVPPVKTRTHA